MTAGKPHTGGRRPIDSQTRERIEAMARAGKHSRNAIAREFGVSPSTVSRICNEASPPITFDRSMVAAAVEAHVVDLKAARAELAQKSVDEARRLFGLLTAEHEVIHWDKEGFMHRGTIDRPTSGDIRNYATAIGILVDKHAVLARFDSDDRDLPAVEVFLRGQGVPALFGGAA